MELDQDKWLESMLGIGTISQLYLCGVCPKIASLECWASPDFLSKIVEPMGLTGDFEAFRIVRVLH